jgi:nucleoside-diphosphate-sugar epimerase
MRLLVTGASGFVGSAVLRRCALRGELKVRGAVRRNSAQLPAGVESATVNGLSHDTNWSEALTGVDAIVHAAARGHVMRDPAADPLSEYRNVNVAGTMNLANQAVEAGVRRFIFLSSIKANGEDSPPATPFTAESIPAPIDPYGISKLEAETALRRLAERTGLELVIIRPVLVYGPGVKGNFLSIMRMVNRGIPLPLGAIHNRRSLVGLDNLVDLILLCRQHQAAINQTFMVSDGEDLSTTALLRRTAAALGRPARLMPVPTWVLWTAARILGKPGFARRLCGSLQVDISKTRQLLGWTPPVSVDDGLQATARHFLANQSQSA